MNPTKTPLKAQDLILVTSDLDSAELTGPNRMQWKIRLQHAVQTAREMDLNPILVLGPQGDQILLLGPELESCDLAFDPNFDGDLFSSIKAGLHAVSGAAFIWPLQHDLRASVSAEGSAPGSLIGATSNYWTTLDNALRTVRPDDPVDAIRIGPAEAIAPSAIDQNSANQHPDKGRDSGADSISMIYPQLVTVSGAQRLRRLPADTQWTAPTVRFLTVSPHSSLFSKYL